MIELDGGQATVLEVDDDGRVDEATPGGEAAELAARPGSLGRRGIRLGGEDGVELERDVGGGCGGRRHADSGAERRRLGRRTVSDRGESSESGGGKEHGDGRGDDDPTENGGHERGSVRGGVERRGTRRRRTIRRGRDPIHAVA